MSDTKNTPSSNVITQQIKKRDGRITAFDKNKIAKAINKSLTAVGKPDPNLAKTLADGIAVIVSHNGHDNSIPSVETIQDLVEAELLRGGYPETAKAYVLYRHEREQIRNEKQKILNKTSLDEIDKSFDINALRVLASRYLIRDEDGQIIESPKQLFERIAIHMTIPDILYDTRVFGKDQTKLTNSEFVETCQKVDYYREHLDDFENKFHIGKYYLNKYHIEGLIRLYMSLRSEGQIKVGFKELLTMLAKGEFKEYDEQIEEYCQLMIDRDFLPNTPTLMNSGARLGQLSACFVLQMHDNIESIMKTASDTAFIFKSGGGVGINYSELRPKGQMVFSTSGVASGPVSFMQIVNTITEVVKQGGKRRGANMGIMDVSHPDIEEFITAKTKAGVLENFNVSVGMNSKYWKQLINKDDNADTKRARQLFDLIAHSAWKSAEPGVIFFDKINEFNPLLEEKGELNATNPCGEQSLYPYESCNLGSINLANFIDKDNKFDWQRFTRVVQITTRFLDNVIDMNKYPVPEIADNTKLTRRIGLGIMGIADLLFKIRIPYASEEGYKLMEEIAQSLTYLSMSESVGIAVRRGSFPLFDKSSYKDGALPIAANQAFKGFQSAYDGLREDIKANGIRNAWTTTIAPTGTLSMIAHCSNGVEPVYALGFEKRVTVGSFFYSNKELENVLKAEGLYSDELIKKIINNYGSVRGLQEIPKWIQDIFVTAIDLHWTDHLLAQAVWQKWITNAIAKTINMPHDVTVEDVKNAYLLGHELGLKGLTVYRDGSRHEQVLHIHSDTKDKNFSVTPSDYVAKYVYENIAEPFVRERIMKMFDEIVPAVKRVTIIMAQDVKEPVINEINNGQSCPECKALLVVTEGCKLCISCGFSYCSSG